MAEKLTSALAYIIDFTCDCGGHFVSVGTISSYDSKLDAFKNKCNLCNKIEYLNKAYPVVAHKRIDQ